MRIQPWLIAAVLGLTARTSLPRASAAEPDVRLATFEADVTPPLGHALLAGLIAPAQAIADPLSARGLVLLGGDGPVVLVAIDWCEIRNDAHDRWRSVLAEAAGTVPSRVFVHSVHQHDAPVADLEAQRILDAQHVTGGQIINPEFHETCVQRTAQALRDSLANTRPVTHLGTGSALVEQVASNRRVDNPDGSFHFGRTSASARDYGGAPEGLVDPVLRTLSFWNGSTPLAGLHCYATHPMTHYGQGKVSCDFPGLARARRQADDPAVFQIYLTGCSGNITAGKYNDGAPENRRVLANRLYQAMKQAWDKSQRYPLENISFRRVTYRLPPRDDPDFTVAGLKRLLADPVEPFRRKSLAALGLSWRQRVDAGRTLDLPVLDLGPAEILLLPGESYVEYQLYALSRRPDTFLLTPGFGECAPGYIPTDQHFAWKDGNLGDWCWVAPGSERQLREAIGRALTPVSANQGSTASPWKTNPPIVSVRKELHRRSPRPGAAALVAVRYVGPRLERMETHAVEFRDDVHNERFTRLSRDNGRSWGESQTVPSTDVYYEGKELCEAEGASVFDPDSGLLVGTWLRQIKVGNLYNNFTYYRLSDNLGRTWSTPEQLRYESGPDFNPKDPHERGFLQPNQAYFGNNILRHSNGTLIHCVAHANAPGDPRNDQRPWRMGSLCFIGRWVPQTRQYQWEAGQRVEVSPEVSARGLMEPEVAELRDGRVLIVWRGSTHGWDGTVAKTPGRKFHSVSTDGGRTLSAPAEWAYDDGTSFYSPSSIHRMIRHSRTGKLYWIGNISATPPAGNEPRYPLVIAEVDESKAALRKNTVTAVDDRRPDQPPKIQLSNFSLLENRETQDVEIYLTLYGEYPDSVYTADCYRYTLTLSL